MRKFNELLGILQKLDIIQTSGDWSEDLPEDIWTEWFKGSFKEVAHNLGVSTHRWFETSISVFEIHGGLLGIEYITNMFSESQMYEDCYCKIGFHEMKPIQTVTYVVVK